jgi:crotonobetainyl-CoA:carnitine CoA-transferase CaiB-like acyl-CoA transferase
MSGPLTGLRVFDLTRILAGPMCTQILGDLGADIIKIERPGAGDDTRKWGPPFVKDKDGNDTTESAYYLAINRNKRSVTLDISKQEGQALARLLIARCDIFIENFKVGDMAKYRLNYEELKLEFPRLIYCSITGSGRPGLCQPRRLRLPGARHGRDHEHHRPSRRCADQGRRRRRPTSSPASSPRPRSWPPLQNRHVTGHGQYVDMSLLDSQVGWLANAGLQYLTSGPGAAEARQRTSLDRALFGGEVGRWLLHPRDR